MTLFMIICNFLLEHARSTLIVVVPLTAWGFYRKIKWPSIACATAVLLSVILYLVGRHQFDLAYNNRPYSDTLLAVCIVAFVAAHCVVIVGSVLILVKTIRKMA